MYYIPEENKFEILKVKNLLERRYGNIEYSDFLSPFAQKYVIDVILKDKNRRPFYQTWGGYEESERKVLAIFSDSIIEGMDFSHFPIDVILVDSDTILSHRQILGTFIGQGLKRDKIGDILVKEHKALVFVKKEVSLFITTHIDKIGRDKVKIEIVNKDELDISQFMQNSGKRIVCSVPSMRVDAIVSHGFGISREEASDLVRQFKVAVNWVYIDKPSHEVKEGDLISVRRHGRLKVEKVLTTTKKGRISIELLRFS
ncbi:YlmH family RNA-binding protein [Caldicellulosiruptor naganoensis]|uniref:YlmH/Sll1252 family protein n=1 Tax=Caldicellulosiruptor naganoensis TaxID=29324 RepID=A0ABY7BHV0_9FIRM|nr:YlmH/Sll1252 family protein [Caldicellulosiruptor naganoensis]WAM30616.1 YlmH/Sll1252 family protein [Caldicellulosiruptor naganoensis]